MRRRRSVSPRLEQLEDRCTPTVWNIPWTDGSHLTVSFVPDGTSVDGTSSVLYQKMAMSGLSTSVWQGEILRAFQAWSDVTNVNFAVVPDDGAPLGAPGAYQGDSRFGDIRIACIPMNIDVLALTTPPGALTGTRAGDIVFNANDLFTVGSNLVGNLLGSESGLVQQDLYTVAQHEIGHALGLPDNDNSSSAMYAYYQGAETGLGAVDVANIQALYGTPAPDAFAAAGAAPFSTAWPLQAPAGAPANASLAVAGDLTTSTDANWFQFTTGSVNPTGVTLQLQTSTESLLAGQVSVYNSNQQLLATTAATGPGQDLTLSLNQVSSNTTYYVEVNQVAGTLFNVGAYQLTVVFNPNAPTVAAPAPTSPLDNHGTDATLGTALGLQTTAGYTANTHYSVSAIQDNASNVDVYSLQSASVAPGVPNVMTIAVQVPSSGVLPTLAVYNSNQQQVADQVLNNGYGYASIQVANALSNATYYVVVSANPGTQAASPYRLDISFCSQTVSFNVNAQGTLNQLFRTAVQLMTVSQSDFRYFTLNATGGGNSAAAWVKVTIYNPVGQVVGNLTVQPGQTVGGIVVLNAGVYIVDISAGTSDGSALKPINYVLGSVSVSSPVGATVTNPNQASGSGNTTTQSSSTGSTSTASSGSSTTPSPANGSASTSSTSTSQPASPSLTATAGGTVMIGSGAKLTDSATLSGGNNETGTITFTLYNPSSTVVDTVTATVSGNGTYSTPSGYLPSAAGTYQWVASYSGDSNNNGVSGAKGSETVSTAGPSLTTASGGNVVVGTKLTNSATLSGGYNETGTITFTLYNPSNTVVDTETVKVSGNGTYSTPNGYLPSAAGTYQWVVSYSGDANNNAITSAKGSEPEMVSAASPTLSTTSGGNVRAGSGTKMTDSVTLSGGYNETGTITFTLYNPSNAVVDTETVTVSGNGTYSTPNGYLPNATGTYQWVVSYGGDSNNNGVTSTKGSDSETVYAGSTT